MFGDSQVIFATSVFFLTYTMIVWEKLHRAVVALAGAVIVLLAGIITQEEAIDHIDFNTIGLLIGMMIIVAITRRTGVFEYMAIKAAKVARGEPVRIMIYLAVITAAASALLDNVTTVLLMVPVSISLANELKINPMPFLITEIISSNIGGTATLIGDPPNIMISGPAGLSFMDFIFNLTPVAVVIFIVTIFLLKIIFKKGLTVEPELKEKILSLNEVDEIKDYALLKKSLAVLGLTILGFALHSVLHLESATIALSGAALLLIITREEPEDVLLSVEWPTIFFFIGLFVVVGSLVEVGVIAKVAEVGLSLTGGEILPTGLLILWLSALASSIVDNIPFVATMIPLIQEMGNLGISNLEPLWWSLALGACLGGNGTLVGAAANVIVAGIAEKNGYPISFLQFLKIGFPIMIVSIIISTAYLLLFFLR